MGESRAAGERGRTLKELEKERRIDLGAEKGVVSGGGVEGSTGLRKKSEEKGRVTRKKKSGKAHSISGRNGTDPTGEKRKRPSPATGKKGGATEGGKQS